MCQTSLLYAAYNIQLMENRRERELRRGKDESSGTIWFNFRKNSQNDHLDQKLT